jgi:hypothetical protein
MRTLALWTTIATTGCAFGSSNEFEDDPLEGDTTPTPDGDPQADPDADPPPDPQPEPDPEPEPDGEFHADVIPGEIPYYTTPTELCDWVNEARNTSSGHERYKGLPWHGEYHSNRTWPIAFTVDEDLMAVAQAEADRLGADGGPEGAAVGPDLRYHGFWIEGVDTAEMTITAEDIPGDWDPGYFKAPLLNANANARQGLYYHDAGGDGPELERMGCGGANAEDGSGIWWVIVLEDRW